MATYLLFVSFPILLSYIISTFSGQKIVALLPLSYFIATFWAFGFGLVDRLDLGVTLLFPILLILISFLVIFKRDFVNKQRLLELSSPAMVCFLGLTAWTFIHSKSMRFYAWDEFSGWGPFVKSMFLFDKLGPYSPADLPFADYITGISMLPYMAMKIEGQWNEAGVYWSYQVLIISILVAIFPAMKWRQYGLNVLAIVLSLLAATFFYNSFQSIYADPLLGLLFGLGIVIATSKDLAGDKWSYLNFVALVTFISVTKEIGIYFSLTLILIMFARICFVSTDGHKRKVTRLVTSMKLTSIAVLPLVTIQICWRVLLSNQQIPSSRSIFAIAKKVLVAGEEGNIRSFWSDEVFSNFSNKTFVKPLTAINGVPLTTIMWLTILTFLLGMLIRSTKRREDMWEEAIVLASLMLGFLGYLIVLFFLYLTVFTEGEAADIASYERYIPTYFAGIVLYLNYRFINEMYSPSKYNKMSIFTSAWIVVLLLQSSPVSFLTYVINPNTASDNLMTQFDAERKVIKNMNLQVDDDVWIISQHTKGFEFYFFSYELLPASVGGARWSIGSSYGEGDIWTDTSYNQKKWEILLNNYEFVYVHRVTESFVEEFGSMFDDSESLTIPGFYKVIRESDGIKLIRVISP